jgi:hypothetical protein
MNARRLHQGIFLLLGISGLDSLGAATPPASQLSGAVVEAVAKTFAGDRAGIQPQDVILSWRRVASQSGGPAAALGSVASPFDLAWVEIEQAPRGAVTLTGRRGSQRMEWLLPAGA